MRFGAMNFPVAPVLPEIEAIGNMNMDFVELAMDPPQARYDQLQGQKGPILEALERFGMGLVCHLPTFVYTAHLAESIRKASLAETIASLETAAALGAEKVVVHPGFIDGLAVHVQNHAMALAMDSLAQLYSRSQSLGVMLCIENMFPRAGPFTRPEDFEPIFEAFPEMKLVLDTGHANIGDYSRCRIEDFIRQYADRLEHLHMSDNFGQQDEHLPLGHGNIEFRRVVRALRTIGFDKTITLEVFGVNPSELIQSRLKIKEML